MKTREKVKEEFLLIEMDDQEKSDMIPNKRRRLNTSETENFDESWTPDWAKNKVVHLCPNNWCTYNAIGTPKNMKRHAKVCQTKFGEGLRLQHKGGEFAPDKV